MLNYLFHIKEKEKNYNVVKLQLRNNQLIFKYEILQLWLVKTFQWLQHHWARYTWW